MDYKEALWYWTDCMDEDYNPCVKTYTEKELLSFGEYCVDVYKSKNKIQ